MIPINYHWAGEPCVKLAFLDGSCIESAISKPLMSALGHKRTLNLSITMSALPPKAYIRQRE